MTTDTTQDGREYVGAECTLDGRRAIVCGRLLAFGWVATLPDGPRVEYAWPTIARVMSAGGRFES